MAARILIVDDDAVARRLVENMVLRCGYDAGVVDSGDAAVAALTAGDAQSIDAVVLDLVMPGLDGMGGAGQDPRPRSQRSRHRADRPWRHRQCGIGDALRRPRFRGQTGRRRTAAGVVAQCSQCQRAERRIATHPAQP